MTSIVGDHNSDCPLSPTLVSSLSTLQFQDHLMATIFLTQDHNNNHLVSFPRVIIK